MTEETFNTDLSASKNSEESAELTASTTNTVLAHSLSLTWANSIQITLFCVDPAGKQLYDEPTHFVVILTKINILLIY